MPPYNPRLSLLLPLLPPIPLLAILAILFLPISLLTFLPIIVFHRLPQITFHLLKHIRHLFVLDFPLLLTQVPSIHSIRVRQDQLDEQANRGFPDAARLVLKRLHRRTRHRETLLRELGAPLAELRQGGEHLDADVGRHVEHALEEQVVQPVDLLQVLRLL